MGAADGDDAAAASTSGSGRQLLHDRRALLEHALAAYTRRGGRLRLPPGGAPSSPALLDALDVRALLRALDGEPGAVGAPLELAAFCRPAQQQQPRTTATSDAGPPPDGAAPPDLALPELATGLADGEVKDAAFLVLAATCPHEGELLELLAGQLGIDAARADEARRLLARVGGDGTGSAAPGGPAWGASLELPLCLLGALLPGDCSRFRSFVLWRETLSRVLLASLARNARDGWRPPPGGGGAAAAQQLTARLKAALRRLDVRTPEDYDEAEYQQAAAAVRQQAQALAQCTAARWALPWGLRVALLEALLAAGFDAVDEGAIDDAPRYLRLLETRVAPLLGVGPVLHGALAAWVTFRQFAATRAPPLLAETQRLLAALLQQQQVADGAAPSPLLAAQRAGGGGGAGSSSCSEQDRALAAAVGEAVVRWSSERLGDYHARLADPGAVGGLVELLARGARSGRASDEQVGQLLLDAVSGSVAAELRRRLDAADDAARGGSDDDGDALLNEGGDDSPARRCATACRVAQRLVGEERAWTEGFRGQLPEAHAVAAAVLQASVGGALLPWLASAPPLDEPTCDALRAALDLEPLLMQPIQRLQRAPDAGADAAGGGCRYACTARLLGRVAAWDMPQQLSPLLGAWLDAQMAGFGTWVDRQLQQEDWRPLGVEQPHASSAREVRRIALESLEALFGLGLPLPPDVVRQHMAGIGRMAARYLDAVLALLGSPAALVPPPPPLARYKRQVAVAQEDGEAGMPGLPRALPPRGCSGRRGAAFLESVRRAEDEPCAARVAGLSASVLAAMLASLAYLADTLAAAGAAVKQMRQQQEAEDERRRQQQERGGGGGTAVRPARQRRRSDNPFEDDSSSSGGGGSSRGTGGGGAANPFLDAGADAGGFGSSGAAFFDGRANGAAAGSRQLSGAAPRPLSATRMQWSGAAAAAVWGGSGGGASGGGRDDQLGSLRDVGQRLRAGVDAVTRWLAARVVWWEQRAGWCELLYRHRMSACRIDWLLEALACSLQDVAGLLPQEARSSVALALLREAAHALERALLDGGPCRWFVPADVPALQEDVEALRSLFFQAGVQMQDIRPLLGGLQGVLAAMAQPTGPLIDAHRAARRAALLGGTPSGSGAGPCDGAPLAQPTRLGGPDSRSGGDSGASGGSGGSSAALGPLAAAKLAAASSGGSATAPGSPLSAGRAAAAGCRSAPQHSRQPTGGSASSFAAGRPDTPSQGGSSAAASGAAAAAGVRRTAMDVAASGGDVERCEPILLRVLCHRADHAASKYLKEVLGVPKPREETIGEALGRLARLGR